MWLLITFIAVWALSPGPVFVMTIHEARKNGLMAGIAVAGGATLTSTLMVVSGLLVHSVGFSAILEMDSMLIIEQLGAIAIILMGLYTGYKSLCSGNTVTDNASRNSSTRFGFIQGMLVMATYTPQALIFYNVIVPQTLQPEIIITAITALGTLKLALILGWHSVVAYIAIRAQNWAGNTRFEKPLEIATACLIMGLGINILI